MIRAEGTDVSAAPAGIGADAALPARDRDAQWLRYARYARWLAWASLLWMVVEGAVGLVAGYRAGSIALIGWAFGSAVEGLASGIVIWRFSGGRTLSETAERRAQQGIAVSWWVLAPYIAAEALHDLVRDRRPEVSILGIVITAVALLEMPLLGRTKRWLGSRLGSAATVGEGRQNYVCAAQAAAVLLSLCLTAVWAGGWWITPVVALGLAGWAVLEGREAWRGDPCTCTC